MNAHQLGGNGIKRSSSASLSWAVDCMATLWFPRSKNESLFNECSEDSYILALATARLCVQNLAAHRFEASNVGRAKHVVYSIMCAMLWRVRSSRALTVPLQDELCKSMLEVSSWTDVWPDGLRRQLDSLTLRMKEQAASTNTVNPFSKDFHRTIQLLQKTEANDFSQNNRTTEDFDNPELGQAAKEMLRSVEPPIEMQRPSKRPRTQANGSAGKVVSGQGGWFIPPEKLARILGRHFGPTTDFPVVTLTSFASLPQEKQCELLAAVGQSACSFALGTASVCTTCDSISRSRPVPRRLGEKVSEEMYAFMLELVKACQEQKSPPPRVAAMVSLKRTLAHTGCNPHLDLKSSALGHWCLQSLRSSARELRLAAV